MRAGVLTVFAISLAASAFAFQPDGCAGARDLRLTNGRIVTMDARNSIVSEVTIQSGRFAAVGPPRDLKLSPCTRIVDLGGRTVVPGLVDNHNHIVLLGLRPGHDLRLETAGCRPKLVKELYESCMTWIQRHILRLDVQLKSCRTRTVPPGPP